LSASVSIANGACIALESLGRIACKRIGKHARRLGGPCRRIVGAADEVPALGMLPKAGRA